MRRARSEQEARNQAKGMVAGMLVAGLACTGLAAIAAALLGVAYWPALAAATLPMAGILVAACRDPITVARDRSAPSGRPGLQALPR